MNWKYFAGAVIVTAGAMVKAGAPLETIAAGIGFAAIINIAKRRLAGKVQR
jgi:hypothetical protein